MSADPNSAMGRAHVDLQVRHAELGSCIPGRHHKPAELAEAVIEMRDACNTWMLRLAEWIESRKQGDS